jgi:hypothetical protein
MTPLHVYGPPSSLPAGLDWSAFAAAYFPGRHRHDLEAVVAYGAYRRFHAIEHEPERELSEPGS